MALPIIAAAALITGLGSLYQMVKRDPNADLAQYIKQKKIDAAQSEARHMQLSEETHQEFSMARKKHLEGLVELKQGLDEGYKSPVEYGIEGGGLSARDMPLVRMMAANLGMDPQDLVARFDPMRSNFFTPSDRRGETVTSPLQDVIRRKTGDQGPAQMNPTGGFGL